VGKTRLALEVSRALGGSARHVTFPAMPASELLAYVAEELGAPADPAPGLAGSVRRVRALLAASAARGEPVTLIVDEAHLIDEPATFEALRLLLNFRTAGPPDLSLLLVGGPEMLLTLPEGLADRLAACCLLPPLSESESSAYVEGRVVSAGGPPDLFASEARTALHRAAEGRPRRLNRLADLCLLIAYAEGRSRVDRGIVEVAAREIPSPALVA
jgi:type II secretory pathway predicted ATPase ExeA